MNITLKYFSGGIEHERSFPLLAVRGADDPDEFRIVGQQYVNPSGEITEQIVGFKRIMTLDFGVVQSLDDRIFLHGFLTVTGRRIAYDFGASEEWHVELYEPERFSNEWLEDSLFGRRFVLKLVDKNVLQIFPTGKGYGYDYGGQTEGYGNAL